MGIKSQEKLPRIGIVSLTDSENLCWLVAFDTLGSSYCEARNLHGKNLVRRQAPAERSLGQRFEGRYGKRTPSARVASPRIKKLGHRMHIALARLTKPWCAPGHAKSSTIFAETARLHRDGTSIVTPQ